MVITTLLLIAKRWKKSPVIINWHTDKQEIGPWLSPPWNAVVVESLSRVHSSATPQTVARQAPLSWDSPGKNTGAGCHFLLQGIFPTQGSNLCLLHWYADSLPLSRLGSPQYYSAPEKRVTIDTGYNTDELANHYTNWKRRPYTLYDFVYTKCPEKANLQTQKSSLVIVQGWRECPWQRVSSWDDENVLKVNSGGGCTTLNILQYITSHWIMHLKWITFMAWEWYLTVV